MTPLLCIARPTTSFTRPADTTAYTIGDLVANSTTAGSVSAISLTPSPFFGAFRVRRVKLRKTDVSTTNAQFRVHLFTSVPTVANGDNGAFSATGVAGYIGAADVTVGQAFTDGAAGFALLTVGTEAVAIPSASTLYALLEALAAYTPASAETFTLTVECEA